MPRSTYRRTELPSGLRIVTERDNSVRSVSVGVWIDVGSRYETPALAGLSHLIEHMTFKGTRRRNARQIVEEFEARGGGVNAFTSREQTCYYAKVLDTHLPVAIDVLGDIVRHSLYDIRELGREQKIILEEIKDVHDTPSDWVHDLFAEVHWGRAALGLPVLGHKATVKRARRDDIMAYRRRFYRTKNTVISACGAVDHDRFCTLIRSQFDGWRSGRAYSRSVPVAPVRGGKRVIVKDTAQTHLVIGFPSISYVEPRKYALLVLQQLFGGGMSSRLFQRIREELSLAYNVYAFQDAYRDCGVFGLYMATDPRNAATALDASLHELGRLKRGDLPAAEVQAAREQLKGHMVLGLENTSSRMNRIARHEIYTGDYLSVPDTLKCIDRVTRDDLVDMAEEIIDAQRVSAIAMGPLPRTFLGDRNWSSIA